MPEEFSPAPLWRRCAAAAYDGPLLVVVWVVVAAVFATVQLAARAWSPPDELRWLAAAGSGALFFGWFWTRGGQSPGMRAWNLRLQRTDGASLRWPVAVLRFLAMLGIWCLVLVAPVLILLSWKFGDGRDGGHAHIAALVRRAESLSLLSASATVLMLILRRLDRLQRLPQDFVASVVVVRVRRPRS